MYNDATGAPARALSGARAMRTLFAAAVALAFLIPLARAQSPASVPKDVVLVLDNSGSMRKHDPGFLAREAVTTFIGGLDQQTRVQIVIFDQTVRVAVPFTPVTDASRPRLLASLEGIDYRGQFTDSPAAVERAVYDLKTEGRDGVEKLVVFMTDGIVDTGDGARDAEAARWLREDLSADAALAGVRIFAIAFTDQADFQLIQSLARRTGGEYFRALAAADLQAVFERIDALIAAEPQEPAPARAAPEALETAAGGAVPAGAEPPGARTAQPSGMAGPEPGAAIVGAAVEGEALAGRIEAGAEREVHAGVAEPGPGAAGSRITAPESGEAGPGITEPGAGEADPRITEAGAGEGGPGITEPGPVEEARAGLDGPVPYGVPEADAAPAPVPAAPEPPAPPVPDVRILLALAAIALAGVVLLVVVLALVVRRQRGAGAVPAARAAPRAYLNDVHGVTREPAYEIGARPLMLGRLAGTDRDHDYLVINRSTVGRRHALIEYRAPDYWVVDQGSINGTFVNGERVSGERRLAHGDRIRLHQFEFEFMAPGLAGAGASQGPGAARDNTGLQTVVGTAAAVAAARPAAGMAHEAEAAAPADAVPVAPHGEDARAGEADFLDVTGQGAAGDATEEHARSFNGGDTAVLDAAPAPEALAGEADFLDVTGQGAAGDATEEHARSFNGGDTAILDAAPAPEAGAVPPDAGEPAAPPEPGTVVRGSPDTLQSADIDLFTDTGAGLTPAGEMDGAFTDLFGAGGESEPQGEPDADEAQLEPEPRPPISTIVLDLSDEEPPAQPAGDPGPVALDAATADAAPSGDGEPPPAPDDDDLFGADAGDDRADGGVAAPDGMADEELSLDEFLAAAGVDGGEDPLPGSGDAGEGGDERVPVPGQLDDRSPQS